MCIRTTVLNSLFLPESFWGSSHGYATEADFICPQAFGRNTYPDNGRLLKMKNWLRRLFNKGEFVHIDIVSAKHAELGGDIATFEWLKAIGFEPGEPNEKIAAKCIGYSEIKPGDTHHPIKPIIGQWEVMYALWRLQPYWWYTAHAQDLIAIWPPAQGYLGTRGMLLIVKNIAQARDLYNPLIVAYPEHIQRCFFIARKIFSGSIAIDHDWNTGEEWFDKQSVQSWTRTPKAWLIYEMCVRIHHRLHGWM